MKGYQIKITIKGSKPPIWRRVIVPDRISFYQLHQTIQMAFGWWDSHLHEFEFPTAGIQVADSNDEMGLFETAETWSEKELIDSLVTEFPRFVYTYDFGDFWEHQLLVEKEVDYPCRYPTVIKYKGNNLPEDCGGIWGYYDLLERLKTEPDNEELRQWAMAKEMEPYDMAAVNRDMEKLVFQPGRKRAKRRSSQRKNNRQEKFDDDLNGIIARFESQLALLKGQFPEEKLTDIYRQYDKEELKRIARLHRMTGYSGMKKEELVQSLAEHVQKREVMERYFRFANDEEIQVFERAAAMAGEACDPGDGACQYLHYGGYFGMTDLGDLVVVPSVAREYQAFSTEQFHKHRQRTYLIWAYMEAAVYLYGVVADEETAALFNLYESDILTIAELHNVFREVQGLRCGFKYKNGFFFDAMLEENQGCSRILKEREGKKAYIPSKELVLEIADLGISEPNRQLRPWINFISNATDIDPVTAFEAAAVIHHQIRMGCRTEDVIEILSEAGVFLETEEESREFAEVFQSTWNQTRMVSNYGYTPEELHAAAPESKMDAPCPCGSGKRFRQCCGRKNKE